MSDSVKIKHDDEQETIEAIAKLKRAQNRPFGVPCHGGSSPTHWSMFSPPPYEPQAMLAGSGKRPPKSSIFRFAGVLQLPQLFKSWWVVFFALICFICYEQGMKSRNAGYQTLMKQLTELRKEKEKALARQADLIAQIQSQQDGDWIELTLMRELGVIPEGQRKVFFKE